MDAVTQLALMAKAKRIFESEDTFLSFPALSPLSYPPERLRFADGAASAQDLADLSEFSRIANQLPRGVVAPVVETEYLWDVCAEALATGTAARGALSDEEKARLDATLALLYRLDADGRRQDAPALAAYKQHRDAHIAAQEEYRNQQLTAEASGDPAAKAAWAEAEEPRLRAEIQRIGSEWLTAGDKARVEEAMQVEQGFAAREPSLLWEDWRSAFIDDIDLQTDTGQIRFAPTGFAPAALFEHGAWPRFTLTGAEVARLAGEAPPELLDIFGAGLGASDIESVSFEYRSVALTRHWMPKRLFEARFWRLGPAGGELSAGGAPPQGRCPAYIAALVFARNVEVRRRAAPGMMAATVATRPGALLQVSQAALRADSAAVATAKASMAAPRAAAPTANPAVRLMLQRSSAAAALRAEPVAALSASTLAAPRIAMPAKRGPAPSVRGAVLVRDHRVARPRVVPAPPILPPRPFPRPLPVPQPPPPPPEAGTPPGEVAILAFICKRLGRSPDPDPGLDWS